MSRYLEDDDFIEQERFRIARERVVAAQTPTTTAFENLDEEQKRMRLAADYARDANLAAKPAIPTSFNPAAFRIAEEKSMGADIPPGVTPQYPFEPVAEITSDDPDDDPDDEPELMNLMMNQLFMLKQEPYFVIVLVGLALGFLFMLMVRAENMKALNRQTLIMTPIKVAGVLSLLSMNTAKTLKNAVLSILILLLEPLHMVSGKMHRLQKRILMHSKQRFLQKKEHLMKNEILLRLLKPLCGLMDLVKMS
jgi:hypothetical protein